MDRNRTYLTVGSGRLLNIRVILDDNQVLYDGTAENAPQEIKNLLYSKIEIGSITNYYVYSNLNEINFK